MNGETEEEEEEVVVVAKTLKKQEEGGKIEKEKEDRGRSRGRVYPRGGGKRERGPRATPRRSNR